MVSWVGLALTFRKRYDAFKSVDISDGIVNPIYRYGVEITPDINPIYVGLEKSCIKDSKNVSYVGIGLV